MVTVSAKYNNFSTPEKNMAVKALARLQLALNSPSFTNMILSSTYENTPDSPTKILGKLLSGSDRYTPDADSILQVEFQAYYNWFSRVIGYVSAGSRTIHVNRKYVRLDRDGEINFASNALHEYCHLIGYDHRSARDSMSVPYRINYLFEKWCHETGL